MFNGLKAYQKCGFADQKSFIAEMQRLHQGGLTKDDLMKQFGLGEMTIYRLFKKNNIETIIHSELHNKCGFITKEACIKEITRLYWDDKLDIDTIAIKLNTTYITVRDYMARNNIKTRSQSEYIQLYQEDIILTDFEQEIIDGCLLGDGSMAYGAVTAKITYACKYKSVCESLKGYLSRVYYNEPKKKSYFDKRTQKQYTSFSIESKSFKSMLDLRKKWYPNGIKIIPNDLKLTPEMCYWWYLGDGSSANNSLMLCTNCFTIDEVDYLISQLPMRALRYMQKGKNGKIYPIIMFTKISERRDFLEYIGKCRHYEYNHRWIIHTRKGPITDYCLPYKNNDQIRDYSHRKEDQSLMDGGGI